MGVSSGPAVGSRIFQANSLSASPGPRAKDKIRILVDPMPPSRLCFDLHEPSPLFNFQRSTFTIQLMQHSLKVERSMLNVESSLLTLVWATVLCLFNFSSSPCLSAQFQAGAAKIDITANPSQ
jgi:hypothetical protein